MAAGNDSVTITTGLYSSLLDDRRWLSCLEAAGVDNWEGHDIAVELYNGEITEDEI